MSSIIHFTNKFETLKSILDDNAFNLRYCREVFYLGDKISSNAVHPMVSFSEQFVKKINKKNITYGRFGIAMKKSWVVNNKLHPVLYLDRNSTVANALSVLLKARRKNATKNLAPEVKLSIMIIKCFTKNSKGVNSYFKRNDFNFKVEKEWRFVPTKKDIKDNLISLPKSRYEKKVSYYNNKLKKFPLEFQNSDIEYIFVETILQKNEIAQLFEIDKTNIKISKWSTKLN